MPFVLLYFVISHFSKLFSGGRQKTIFELFTSLLNQQLQCLIQIQYELKISLFRFAFELKFLFPLPYQVARRRQCRAAAVPVIRVEFNGEFRVTSMSIGQMVRISLSALEELNFFGRIEPVRARRTRAVSRTTRLFPRAFLRDTKIAPSFHRQGVVQADVTNNTDERCMTSFIVR